MFNRDRGHEQQELGQLGNAIEPYRNAVIAYETDQRMAALDTELLTQGRHVINSNDRFQFSAAHLALARNRATMADAIADGILQPSAAEDLRGSRTDYGAMSTFLVNGYQTAADSMQASDRIAATKGYQADSQELHDLQALLGGAAWPDSSQVTRRFVSGAVAGLRAIGIGVNAQYLAMQKSTALPNNIRLRLNRLVDPLVATLDTAQKSIDLISKGRVETVNSPDALAGIYKDVINAATTVDTLSIWLTVPKLLDSSFVLSSPLDELRPQGKSFSASTLGSSAVQQAAGPRPAATPASSQPTQGPRRPFNPGSLGPATPAPAQDPPQRPSGRPFDPGSLAPSQPTQGSPAQPQGKSFSPDALQNKERKPFDPSSLGRPAAQQALEQDTEEDDNAANRGKKPFNPNDL